MSNPNAVAVGSLLGRLSPKDYEENKAWMRIGDSMLRVPAAVIGAWRQFTIPLETEIFAKKDPSNPALLGYLEQNGLLVSLPMPDDLQSWGALVSQYRAMPIAFVGAGLDESTKEWSVLAGEELKIVSQPGYLVWAHCNGTRTLSQVLTEVAQKSSDPQRFARMFPQLLMELLEQRLVYLDKV